MGQNGFQTLNVVFRQFEKEFEYKKKEDETGGQKVYNQPYLPYALIGIQHIRVKEGQNGFRVKKNNYS